MMLNKLVNLYKGGCTCGCIYSKVVRPAYQACLFCSAVPSDRCLPRLSCNLFKCTGCCCRYLSCARNKLWWMTPEWGTPSTPFKPETQFVLLELEDGGPYVIILPLIDDTFRATVRPAASSFLSPAESGAMALRLESGSDTVFGSQWSSALYIGALAAAAAASSSACLQWVHFSGLAICIHRCAGAHALAGERTGALRPTLC